MTAWREGDVEANGIRIHYTRTTDPGSGKPALVLAHGFSDDGLCWTPVAEALEAQCDVIMVDARGHGRSEAPEAGYNPIDQAADLRGVIGALELRRPAILGHSMGAMTTLVLAGTYPDVPGAILLEDPPDRWRSDSEAVLVGSAWHERTRARLASLKQLTREQMIERERGTNPGWSDAELGPWADSKQRLSLNVLNRSNVAALDLQATAKRISCPALLISGDVAHGALVSQDSAAELRALVPQLTIAHIPETGHSIRRDRLERYLDVVREFLAETIH